MTFSAILGVNKDTMQFNKMFCSDSKRVKHGIFPLIFIGITQWEPYQGLIHSFISFHLQEKYKY